MPAALRADRRVPGAVPGEAAAAAAARVPRAARAQRGDAPVRMLTLPRAEGSAAGSAAPSRIGARAVNPIVGLRTPHPTPTPPNPHAPCPNPPASSSAVGRPGLPPKLCFLPGRPLTLELSAAGGQVPGGGDRWGTRGRKSAEGQGFSRPCRHYISATTGPACPAPSAGSWTAAAPLSAPNPHPATNTPRFPTPTTQQVRPT